MVNVTSQRNLEMRLTTVLGTEIHTNVFNVTWPQK